MAKKRDKRFLYIPASSAYGEKNKDRVRVRFLGKQSQLYLYYSLAPSFAGDAAFGVGGLVQETSRKNMFFKEVDDGDTNYARSKRIVSLVVDRADEKVKAFACPISAWKQLTDQAKENDFEIWREGVGLQTRYYVQPLGLSEVTDEQEQIVSATLESFTFADIFVKKDWELVKEAIEPVENRWQILDFN